MSPYLLVVSMLAASVALAQTPTDGDASPASKMTDATFLKKLAEGNLAEVDEGRLATQKASDGEVKKFGEEMIKDHSQNNSELDALAKQHGIEVPRTIDSKHAAASAKLNAVNGSVFDSHFVRKEVQDHKETIQLLDNEIRNGQDPAVRDFAKKTLHVVQHHLEMARQLETKVAPAVAERGSY